MVKVILQVYPMVRAADEAEREALRPIGRNVERYQEAISGLDDIVKAADELGLWGIAPIEHHFHSEGYELGPTPGLMDAYWAAITKQIRVGQLGYVMTAQNPIRVAEEIAVIDHLSKGRSFAGFARGYQDRWTNVIGQHFGTVATQSDGGAADQANREMFQEHVEMVIEAWTKDTIERNTSRWQIPYPYEDGIDWWMSETTKRLGAPGELDENDKVRRVSVVPAPYQQPHPPVFVATTGSPQSVAFAGRNGFIPTYFSGIEQAEKHGLVYQEAAREGGFNFALGQNQATARWIQIGETREEARQALRDYDAEIERNFYHLLALARPGAKPDEMLPVDAPLEAFAEKLENQETHAWGTVEDVREKLVRQWKLLPAEYVSLIIHYAQQPKESVIRNLELFMTEVKPALDEITQYTEEPAPAPTTA